MACAKCGSESHPLAGYCPQEQKNIRSIQIAHAGISNKKLDRDLEEYRKQREEGNQPKSTRRRDVEDSKVFSNETGRAFRADDMAGTLYPELAKTIREWTPAEKESFRPEMA